jgi:hypothetical protein
MSSMNAIDKLKALSEQLSNDNYHAESDQLDAIIAELTQDEVPDIWSDHTKIQTVFETAIIELEQSGFVVTRRMGTGIHEMFTVHATLENQTHEIILGYSIDTRS